MNKFENIHDDLKENALFLKNKEYFGNKIEMLKSHKHHVLEYDDLKKLVSNIPEYEYILLIHIFINKYSNYIQ